LKELGLGLGLQGCLRWFGAGLVGLARASGPTGVKSRSPRLKSCFTLFTRFLPRVKFLENYVQGSYLKLVQGVGEGGGIDLRP
jgi:hypothetical protein